MLHVDALNNSKYFSILDLCRGYHRVPIRECDKEKTAFSFLWTLRVQLLPFGLCNRAPTFQRLMDSVLSGLLWNTCLVYIDVFSESIPDHVKRLEEVFERFESAGLKLKAKKCFFWKHRSRVSRTQDISRWNIARHQEGAGYLRFPQTDKRE